MSSERVRARCRERIRRLSQSGLDCESIRCETIDVLQRVVGFDRWCWPTADPVTLVPLSGGAEHDYGPMLRRALELEYSGSDIAAKPAIARRPSPVGSLGLETGGDLARSPRWDEVMRVVGISDIAVAACHDAFGCWGWIEVYRSEDGPAFDEDDLGLLASAGGSLGAAMRRGLAGAGEGRVDLPRAPGVIVLGPDLTERSATPAAREWVEALPGSGLFSAWGILPPAVYAVAALARSPATLPDAHAAERAAAGGWVMIESAPLDSGQDGETAVTLRGATARETFELLTRLFGLTRRERDVVAALLAGLDTRAITGRLVISRHTVQDHLKSVFAKSGVHSRRQLLTAFGASVDVA